MKIESITLNNFRQYYGDVSINLETSDSKNIVLIGGKNGYGKTNFLIALVWCLYGERISQVDENFKKEIQKETNYSKFMKQSLNWEAEKDGQNIFSIELIINNIEIPEFSDIKFSNSNRCIIKREFDTNSMVEKLSIKNNFKEIFNNEQDKINFINDYLIPIEAAKFVFFDAEKIASIAALSTKEEGTILNDALGKLLGLDIYKSLEEDLIVYVNNLKKEGANENIREQITDCENAIALNKMKIETIEEEIAQKEGEIKKCEQKIFEYDMYISENSKNNTFSHNRESLLEEKKQLENKEQILEKRFNELSELIPLMMLAGKLDEVVEHLALQEESRIAKEVNVEITQKFDLFIEKLFNQPPEPALDASMSFRSKIFYSEKAQQLFAQIFQNNQGFEELEFEHDLSKADTELIYNTISTIKQQTKEYFEQTIEQYNVVQNEIKKLEELLCQIDANLQDDLILEYLIKKEDEERKIKKISEENGALKNQKEERIKQNNKESQRYQMLIEKVNVTAKRRQKLEKANEYISVLQQFIVSQKKQKKENLSRNIYTEMQKLMHRLQNNNQSFIADVKVEILPDDTGLKVTLYDKDGIIRLKESLSQGEKQLYISSLIKAILAEAIQDFPIFIDTPLGRLDDEHIKNILLYYYPDLAKQVVILATNNEITPKRYQDIKNNVSQSYLLENKNNKTQFKQGYFQSYEN